MAMDYWDKLVEKATKRDTVLFEEFLPLIKEEIGVDLVKHVKSVFSPERGATRVEVTGKNNMSAFVTQIKKSLFLAFYDCNNLPLISGIKCDGATDAVDRILKKFGAKQEDFDRELDCTTRILPCEKTLLNNNPRLTKKLYHATTPKKAKLYQQTGCINFPVRGFTTLQAAMAWSLSINGNRTVFYEVNCNETISNGNIHKLPDHHNQFGEAWWIDENVQYDNIKCVFSAQ